MNERERASWSQIRARGRTAYIIRYGVLLWGVGTALLWNIATALIGNLTGATLLRQGAVAFLLFPLGGILFGLLTWNAAESRYQK